MPAECSLEVAGRVIDETAVDEMVIINDQRGQWYSERDVFLAAGSFCSNCFSNLSKNYK